MNFERTRPITKFYHSIKVPRFYTVCVKVLKDLENQKSSLNRLSTECKHPNKRGVNGLVSKLIEHREQLDEILEKLKLFEREPRFDQYLAKVLITERLWGSKKFVGEAKPLKILRKYESKLVRIFKKLSSVNQIKKVFLPRYVRINTLKITVSKAIERFQKEGWNFKVIHTPETYDEFVENVRMLKENEFMCDIHVHDLLIFPPKATFFDHPWYENGSILLQDKSTCLNAILLSPEEDCNILDMCAAPGMKTTHLAAMISNKGLIYAIEHDSERFEILQETLEYCGARCVKPILQDALEISENECKNVKYILIDPSCSGSGIYKRKEWDEERAFNKKRLYRLAEFQKRLLFHALKTFPNAELVVYSTCSIFFEENERVVHTVLGMVPEFKLLSINRRLRKKFSCLSFESNVPKFNGVRLNDSLQKVRDKCLNLRSDTDLTNGFFIALLKRRKNRYCI